MPSKKTRLRAGDVFAQKYVILSVLGEGGMGVVYEAEHTMLAQRVALKMLKDAARESDEFVKRFGREARAAAKLRSANTAKVFDVDVLDDGTPYMVMEFLEGHDLGNEIDARGRIPAGEAVGYVLEACSAMAEAHSLGIVHRDLKPTNLYFHEQKDGSRVLKVLDFGISKSLFDEEVSVTMTQSSLGTPMYMSPEQIRSAKNVDKRTDIWSLGIILYEMLTGETPFDGESPSAIIASVTADPIVPPREKVPEIPEGLESALMRALSKRADGRHASIEELAEDLLPYAAQPDAWAPLSARSSPRGSLPSVPEVVRLDATIDAAAISSPGVRAAVTADPGATLVEERASSRGGTQENWTSDSGEQRGSASRRVAAVVAAVAVLGGGGFFAVRAMTSSEAPSAATSTEIRSLAVPTATEAPRLPRRTPAPSRSGEPPSVSPALDVGDAGVAARGRPGRRGAGAAAARPTPVMPGPAKVESLGAAPAAAAPAPALAPAPAPAPAKSSPTRPEERHPLTR